MYDRAEKPLIGWEIWRSKHFLSIHTHARSLQACSIKMADDHEGFSLLAVFLQYSVKTLWRSVSLVIQVTLNSFRLVYSFFQIEWLLKKPFFFKRGSEACVNRLFSSLLVPFFRSVEQSGLTMGKCWKPGNCILLDLFNLFLEQLCIKFCIVAFIVSFFGICIFVVMAFVRGFDFIIITSQIPETALNNRTYRQRIGLVKSLND